MGKSNESSMSTVIILWCLVVIMCFSGQFFYGKIKSVSAVKNATEVIQYTLWHEGTEQKYCNLPSHWELNEVKEKEVNNLKFYGDFQGEQERIYGNIQLFEQAESSEVWINNELNNLSMKHNVYEIDKKKIEQKNVKITYSTVDVYDIKTYHEDYYITNSYGDMKVTFSKSYGGFDDIDKESINIVIKSIVEK